jgi:hypothetical protein
MHHRGRSVRPSLLALGLGLMAAGPIQSQSPPAGTLAGLWKLNPELSDRIEEKFRDALRTGAFYGGVRRGPQTGPRQRREDAVTAERELAAMIAPVLQLQIRQDETTVTISDAGGQMQPFATNGRKVKETLLSGTELETQARWKDGRLTIERKQAKVGTVKEVYFVDQQSRKLILEIRLTSQSLPRALEFRRVYDPSPGS